MAINGILIPETGSAQSAGLDFNALATALTTGTLTGLTIEANTVDENFNIEAAPQIDIDSNGFWVINGTTTTHYSKGDNGINGQDGVSPTVSFSTITGGNRMTVVDAQGTSTTDIMDGVSPTVSFSSITGGNRMTVVDDSGTSTVDIMDGITTIQTTKTDLTCTAAATDWLGVSAPYTQKIQVNGLTSSLNPVIDVIISNNVSTGIEEQKQWTYITKATTGTNSLTLSCYEHKPTIDLNIMIEVV